MIRNNSIFSINSLEGKYEWGYNFGNGSANRFFDIVKIDYRVLENSSFNETTDSTTNTTTNTTSNTTTDTNTDTTTDTTTDSNTNTTTNSTSNSTSNTTTKANGPDYV